MSFCAAGTGVFDSDKSALTAAVRAQFGDILSEKQDFFLHIKDEDWGGAFVELLEEQNVSDKAVIEAVIVPKLIEVCFIHVLRVEYFLVTISALTEPC